MSTKSSSQLARSLQASVREMVINMINLYWLLVPFGHIFRFSTPRSDVSIQFSDVLIGLIIVTWILLNSLNMFKSWLRLPSMKSILICAGIWFVSLLVNLSSATWDQLTPSSFYLVRWVCYILLIPLIVQLQLSNLEKKHLLTCLIFSLCVFTCIGFFQYIFFSDFHSLSTQGWDIHMHRLASTWLDTGYAGLFIAFGVFLFTPAAFPTIRSQNYLNPWLYTWQIFIIALGLTFSRASYIAFIAGLLCFSILKRQALPVLIGILSLALVITLAPKPAGEGVNLQRDSTINYRLTNWRQAATIFTDHPLLGIGFNRYRYVQREYGFLSDPGWQASHAGAGVDNSFLFIFAVSGVFGFLGFVYLWLTVLMPIIRFPAPERHSANFTSILISSKPLVLSSLIAWFTHSLFHNTLFYPYLLSYICILSGLSLSSSSTPSES